MEEIEVEYVSLSKYGLMFEALKNGGAFRIGKYVFGLEKGNGYIRVSLNVCGKPISEQVYFNNMVSQKPKKIIKPKEEPKIIKNDVVKESIVKEEEW